MKAVPVKIVQGTGPVSCGVDECTHAMIHIPSRTFPECFPVILKGKQAGTGCWTWNGDTEKPTLRPSVLTRNHDESFRCHSWVNDGLAQFLGDCSHSMAGQTVDLLNVEPPQEGSGDE